MFRAADVEGRVAGQDLAHDKEAAEHPDRSQMLFDGRRGVALRLPRRRRCLGRNMKRFDRLERGVPFIEPDQERLLAVVTETGRPLQAVEKKGLCGPESNQSLLVPPKPSTEAKRRHDRRAEHSGFIERTEIHPVTCDETDRIQPGPLRREEECLCSPDLPEA